MPNRNRINWNIRETGSSELPVSFLVF